MVIVGIRLRAPPTRTSARGAREKKADECTAASSGPGRFGKKKKLSHSTRE